MEIAVRLDDNESFLHDIPLGQLSDDYYPIPTVGGHNCGIYLNKNNWDQIVKCTTDKHEVKIYLYLTQLIHRKVLSENTIAPLYRVFRNGDQFFLDMKREKYSLTDYLFDNYIINKIPSKYRILYSIKTPKMINPIHQNTLKYLTFYGLSSEDLTIIQENVIDKYLSLYRSLEDIINRSNPGKIKLNILMYLDDVRGEPTFDTKAIDQIALDIVKLNNTTDPAGFLSIVQNSFHLDRSKLIGKIKEKYQGIFDKIFENQINLLKVEIEYSKRTGIEIDYWKSFSYRELVNFKKSVGVFNNILKNILEENKVNDLDEQEYFDILVNLEPDVRDILKEIRMQILKIDIDLYEKTKLVQFDRKYDNYVVDIINDSPSPKIIVKMIDPANIFVEQDVEYGEGWIVNSYYALKKVYHSGDLNDVNQPIQEMVILFLESKFGNLNEHLKKMLLKKVYWSNLIEEERLDYQTLKKLVAMVGGHYYFKYLKYKEKYLKHKEAYLKHKGQYWKSFN